MHALKLKLLERNEPQYALAARCGLNETRLSRIVRGRIQPTAEERAMIATALETSVEDLFGGVAAR